MLNSRITRAKYPSIAQAFSLVVFDNCATDSATKLVLGQLEGNGWEPSIAVSPDELAAIDLFFSKLTDEEMETLAAGDQDEAAASFAGIQMYQLANDLLGDWFTRGFMVLDN